MDKFPQLVKEFLQDGTRVEAFFPNLTKEERWVANGRHPLEHASTTHPELGRVLRLKKLTGNFTEVAPVSHFTAPKPTKTPKTKTKPAKAPGDGTTKSSRKKNKIDYSSASDLANLVGHTIQPPNGGLPTTNTYAAQNFAPVKPGAYQDKKPMFIRGILAKIGAMKTLEFHNEHQIELLKRVTTNLSLYLGPIRTPTQAKESIEGIGPELSKQLSEMQKTGCVDNTPPPHGYFLCSAPAMLVALLKAKREEQIEFLPKEQLIERASAICEENFDPIHIGGNIAHVAWSRIHHLEKRNYVKLHQRKQISVNGVYKLEPAGDELAYQLLGEIPPTAGTRAPPRPAAPILAPTTTDMNVEALYSYGVGTDGIFVLVDDREYGGGRHKLGEVCRQLQALNVKHISRRLKVADYMFVRRIGEAEFVVPVLIERKRMDDLASALKTPRYQRQKEAMLYLQTRYPGMMLTYIVEGNADSYRDQIINAGFTGADIEAVIEITKQEGFEVKRVLDTLKHLAEVNKVLTDSGDALTSMLIGTYQDFLNVVKTWKNQHKIPKATATVTPTKAPKNPIVITPKRSSPPTTSTTTTTPSVTCPTCNNILIGSETDNAAHVESCKSKSVTALVQLEKDDVDERVCPSCNTKITGSSEKFASHVKFCLF